MNLSLDNLIPKDEDKDFIELARERYTQARDADKEDREEAQRDADFLAGDQWTTADKQVRELTDRPILVWNRMHTFVAQVANDGRQNKPSVHVTPADGGNKQTSEVIQGRIRQIEYESDADVAYDTSGEQQIGSGRGFYRVTTEYKSPKSNKQTIRIKPIHNQFSVLVDPAAVEYDCCDAEYVFVDTIMSKAAYRRKFGRSTKLGESNFFADSGNPTPEWVNVGKDGEHVRVAEYWVKEFTARTLVTLHNGETAWKDEIAEGTPIVDERESQDWTVVQYIIDGQQVLSRTEWIGKYIPIIPVWGRQEIVRGRKRNVSLIRYAHDAQRLVNLYVSNIAEQIAMMPKTPFIGFEGQFEDHEDEWMEVNNIPRAFLQVKPVTVNGTILPLPQRLQSEPPIQALAVGLGQAVDALKAACNIYDASLGNAPADASGLAIQRRNQESDMGNFHFSDNQARSRKLLGRILLELIPLVDGQEESIPVRDQSGKVTHAVLNRPTRHSDGSIATHKLDDGTYEPHISTGPSYTSQRQEAFSVYSEIAKSDPTFMQYAGDQLFLNADWPGSDVVAERYQKMLPAPLQPAGDSPQAAQQKLQQATQMVQQLTTQLHQLKDELDSKMPEVQARVQIAAMQEETKRRNLELQAEIAMANLSTKANTTRLQAEIGAIQHSTELVKSQEEAEFEQLLAHYQGLSDQQQEQAQQAQPDASGQ